MKIPEVRERLYALADSLEAQCGLPLTAIEIRHLADELKRRPRAHSGRSGGTRITNEKRNAIREFAQLHPEMTEFQIGSYFGVNQGRVSEAISGWRT